MPKAFAPAGEAVNNNLLFYYTSFSLSISMSRINEFLAKINFMGNQDKKSVKFSKSVDFFSFFIYNFLVISNKRRTFKCSKK